MRPLRAYWVRTTRCERTRGLAREVASCYTYRKGAGPLAGTAPSQYCSTGVPGMRALQFAMAEPAVTTRQVPRRSVAGGPSVEMRRFSAGMRAIVALLCTPLLIAAEPHLGPWAVGVMLAYALWAGWVLWAEATARPRLHPLV